MYETKIIKQEHFINMVCDRCKKKIVSDREISEAYTIEFMGGINSVFGEDVFVRCDLCQQCLKTLIWDFCTCKVVR